MNGKLIDGHVQYAPRTITKRFNPYPEEMQIEDGYKPVVDTPMPEPEEGYIWVAHWEEETDSIVRVWEKEIATDDEEM